MSCDPVRLACVCAALSTGCLDCPPDAHVITGMRVLGAEVTPAVAAPGSTVTVRVRTADVSDRALSVAWYRCPTTLRIGQAGSRDAGVTVDGLVAPCLAAGAFATGVQVPVTVDAEGGSVDTTGVRGARRWTDLVGFACAGGDIEPPPSSGLWPRCTGARGVLFTASIPGPSPNGGEDAPTPATFDTLTFGRSGAAMPWTDATVPTVPRCNSSRQGCAAWEIRAHVAGTTAAVESTTPVGADGNDTAFVGYSVTAMAPASATGCRTDDAAGFEPLADGEMLLRWVPPSTAGTVTFWITARHLAGGLVVTQRSVRVQ